MFLWIFPLVCLSLPPALLVWYLNASIAEIWEDVGASVCHCSSPALWHCQFSEGWGLLCARYNLGCRYQPGHHQYHHQGSFLSTNCQSNLGSRRRNVRQFAKNPLLVKDSPISMEKPLPMPTSAQPSPQSAHHPLRAPAVWADPAHAYAQVHISKEGIYVENSNQLNARCSYIHLFSWLNRRPLYTAIVCRGVKRNFKRTFTFNLKFT